MSARYLQLAQHGLRLLNQQDPALLSRDPWKTSRIELNSAIAWLQSLAPATQANPPELSAGERDIAAKFQRKLRDDLNKHIESLAAGGAGDYPAYKRAVGIIAGLRQALATYGDLLKGNED